MTHLPPALLAELLQLAQDQWTRWFPGERRPRRLEYVIQGTGVGKLIVFVLPAGQERPRCLLKVPRSARDSASLAQEYQLVCELRRRSGAAAASLPDPIAAPMVQGWQTVVERLLPGQLFSGLIPTGARFRLDQAARHLSLVREWYVGLQQAVYPRPAVLSAADVAELLVEPIQRAQAEAELKPHEADYLDGLAETARRMAGRPFPLSFVHGDLRPGNILVERGQLYVIDWQFFSQLRGLPLLDWFEFAFRYYTGAQGLEEITDDHDAYRAAFADVFLGAHPYTRLLSEQTGACAQALGLEPEAVDLLLSMWLVDSTNKYLAFLGDRAEHGYLYLMRNPPGGPFRSFRQQLRRQVYPSLLGQLVQSRGAAAFSRALSRQPGATRLSPGYPHPIG